MPASLQNILGASAVSTTWVDRVTHSRDASLYRLVPRAVVRPRSITDVQRLLAWCIENNRHITFRAGGTSLSGQAVSDDILVDLSSGWDFFESHNNGNSVHVGPGITGGRVNALLRRFERKLGPDPASLSAAMIGGIVANNASGMCCGTADNSYNTVTAMQLVLANGVIVDTAEADADAKLRAQSPEIHQGLQQLRDEVRGNAALLQKIRNKYRIKNTMGYSLNAFLDEDEPARILAKLVIGSEGTLAFIHRVTFRTIPDARKKWTSLRVYPTLDHACDAALEWREQGAAAVELMDDASLHSFAMLATTPEAYRVTNPNVAALLVEFHHQQPSDSETQWLTSARDQAVVWRLRKGLMPSIGSHRQAGETMINEDVAVSPEHLAGLVHDVKGAFGKHGYHRAVVFGHAKDGNIHFVLNQRFVTEADKLQYHAFMQEIADLVVGKYNGSLKAEHGTGRNMAPFLEQEWGSEAVGIMWRVKNLLDPHNVLNPGVLLNTDTTIHVQNIKPIPEIDAEVDACIECGFCEHVCPTRAVTLTPRQRIVLRREQLLAEDSEVRRSLENAENYFSVSSCVVDSMCQSVCPVGIDTGALVKRLRAEREPGLFNYASDAAVRMFGLTSAVTGAVARALLPRRSLKSADVLPIANHRHLAPMVYLPSCPSRWLEGTERSLHRIAEHIGQKLIVPKHFNRLCCGQPFESQGHSSAHQYMQSQLLAALEPAAESSVRTIITDTSTCVAALHEALERHGWTVISPVRWLNDVVLPSTNLRPLPGVFAVHPGCGSSKLGDRDEMLDVMSKLVAEVYIPASSTCCGMGGAHGIRYPEVPQASLRGMRHELREQMVNGIATTNAFCSGAIERYVELPTYTVLQVAMAALGLARLP